MTNLEMIQNKSLDDMSLFLTHGGFSCNQCSESDKFGGCDCECTLHCEEWLAKECDSYI